MFVALPPWTNPSSFLITSFVKSSKNYLISLSVMLSFFDFKDAVANAPNAVKLSSETNIGSNTRLLIKIKGIYSLGMERCMAELTRCISL
jgi:hypothetical protein